MRDGVEHAHLDVQLLSRYVSGDLDEFDRQAVTEHLLACGQCWDHVRAARTVVDSVQRLWEPAPPSLRADIRAALAQAGAADATAPRKRPLFRRHGTLPAAVAATALALALATGVVMATHHRTDVPAQSAPVVTTTTIPGPTPAVLPPAVAAAVADHTGPAPTGPVPRAPALNAVGLRLDQFGSTTVAGVPAARYAYRGDGGTTLDLYVATTAWPRPAGAEPVGSQSWMVSAGDLTLLGGPDASGDQMLLVSDRHTTAVKAAAELGMV